MPVVLLDSNPSGIRRAEELGFPVVFGNALQESVMQRARFGFVRTVVALTTNKTLNGVFVARARERFGVPNGLVATSDSGEGLVSEEVERGHLKIVFDGPHDVERWDVRGRRGDVRVEHFVYSPVEVGEETGPTTSVRLSERFVMLTIERNGEVLVLDNNWKFREGDRTAVAIHAPEYDDAVRELAARGCQSVAVKEEDAALEPALTSAGEAALDGAGRSGGEA